MNFRDPFGILCVKGGVVLHKIKLFFFKGHYFKKKLAYAQKQLELSQSHLYVSQKRLLSTQKSKSIECVVSLTSYGKRLNSLHLTLISILTQSVQPKKVIVWLATGEHLTRELNALSPYVSFRFCDDLRSYKKLIPTLKLELELPIVTFDDDVIYPVDQLERLYQTYLANPKTVICHRAHEIRFTSKGLLPYNEWVFDSSEQGESKVLIPIGIGGVLYPPGCFTKEVTNESLFMELCPNADDIWFKYMALKNGVKTKLVSNPTPYKDYLHVAGTEQNSLWKLNKTANDKQLANLLSYDPLFIDMLKD